jgi:hypothetical protein
MAMPNGFCNKLNLNPVVHHSESAVDNFNMSTFSALNNLFSSDTIRIQWAKSTAGNFAVHDAELYLGSRTSRTPAPSSGEGLRDP